MSPRLSRLLRHLADSASLIGSSVAVTSTSSGRAFGHRAGLIDHNCPIADLLA
ncbi:MAG: hypothetical protein HY436_01440, partial [Candidatus Liptonbacteria bacterium]|nr:hypothetical protein [Candidatus Liptonbacteria bacterium]